MQRPWCTQTMVLIITSTCHTLSAEFHHKRLACRLIPESTIRKAWATLISNTWSKACRSIDRTHSMVLSCHHPAWNSEEMCYVTCSESVTKTRTWWSIDIIMFLWAHDFRYKEIYHLMLTLQCPKPSPKPILSHSHSTCFTLSGLLTNFPPHMYPLPFPPPPPSVCLSVCLFRD